MGLVIRLWAWFLGLFASKQLPAAKKIYYVVCERSTCGSRHKVLASSMDEVVHDELAQAFARKHEDHPLTIVDEHETEFDGWRSEMRREKRAS